MKRIPLFVAFGVLAVAQPLPLIAQTKTCTGAYKACVTENSPYGVAAKDRCKNYHATCLVTGEWCTRKRCDSGYAKR